MMAFEIVLHLPLLPFIPPLLPSVSEVNLWFAIRWCIWFNVVVVDLINVVCFIFLPSQGGKALGH